MQETLTCFLGLTQCVELDPTQTTGALVRWYEILTLVGIVFAISEFVEGNKLKAYLMKYTRMSFYVFGSFLLAILCVFFANILPLIPGKAIPVISYPYFWEWLSLLTFTFAFTPILLFTIRQDWFVPKWSKKGSNQMITIVQRAIIYDGTFDGYRALSFILRKNLKRIFDHMRTVRPSFDPSGQALRYELHLAPLDVKAQWLFNEALSDPSFCKYLVTSDIGLLLEIVDRVDRCELWEHCRWGGIFFNSIAKELFLLEKSFLSQEMEYRGIGISQPVFKKLFSSLGLVSHYDIFDSFSLIEKEEITVPLLKKFTTALKISMKKYFSEERPRAYYAQTSFVLTRALKRLIGMMDTLIIGADKEMFNSWNNPYQKHIFEVSHFLTSLEWILRPASMGGYTPVFGEEDAGVVEESLTEGIAEALFDYLDTLTRIRNSEYARHLACSIFWVLFSNSDDPQITKNLRANLLERIKERVEENKQGGYTSMVKLLVAVYGFRFKDGPTDHNGIIGAYIKKEFDEYFQTVVFDDTKAAERFLPSFWKVEGNQIKDDRENVVYEKTL